jgi:hypothetical protein
VWRGREGRCNAEGHSQGTNCSIELNGLYRANSTDHGPCAAVAHLRWSVAKAHPPPRTDAPAEAANKASSGAGQEHLHMEHAAHSPSASISRAHVQHASSCVPSRRRHCAQQLFAGHTQGRDAAPPRSHPSTHPPSTTPPDLQGSAPIFSPARHVLCQRPASGSSGVYRAPAPPTNKACNRRVQPAHYVACKGTVWTSVQDPLIAFAVAFRIRCATDAPLGLRRPRARSWVSVARIANR